MIVYLQGKLAMLEAKLRMQQEADKGKSWTSWWQLEKSARDGNLERIYLIEEIRKTLDQYSKCIRGSEL